MNISSRRLVLSMRYQGYEIPDIAASLSMNEKTVARILDKSIEMAADENRIAIVREAELAKLDEIETAHFDTAVAGNIDSSRLVLKIMERRAAIIGADKQPKNAGGGLTLVQVLAQINSTQNVVSPLTSPTPVLNAPEPLLEAAE